jgi:hypothetical protein
LKKLIVYLFTLVSVCSYCQSNGQPAADTHEFTNATALIIAPNEFNEIAKELSDVYRNILPEGTVTKIVHTEWIREHVSPIPADKLPEGYETHHPIERVPEWNSQTRQGYDYLLAKKIIAFLRQCKLTGTLRYVTLLGSCTHIPPSYYVRGKEHPPYNFDISDEYKFYPTDFFYASPDLDLNADLAVGRLPIRNVDDGALFIGKLKAWYESSRQGDWFHTAAALSGDVCDTRFEPHLGEISVLYSLQKPEAKWKNLIRYFDSRYRTFTASNAAAVLREGNVGWLYHVTHGRGYYIAGSRDMIVSDEIMNYPQAENRLPIFLSVACDNGNYDTPWLPGKRYTYSIGEAVLLSRAGAIAYLGGTGITAGESRSRIDPSGNVVVQDVDYLMQIFDGTLDAYYSAPRDPLLGDLVKSGLHNYVSWLSKDGLKDTVGITMLYSFVFLGDPLLRLPAPQKGAATFDIPRVTTQFAAFRENALSREGYRERYSIPRINLNEGSSVLSLQIGQTAARKLRVLLLDPANNALDDCILSRKATREFSYVFKPLRSMSGPYQLVMVALDQADDGAPVERGEGRCWLWIEYNPRS